MDGERARVPDILGNEALDFVRRSFDGDDAIGILDEPNLCKGELEGSDRKTGVGRM